jgi:hypothetical protein
LPGGGIVIRHGHVLTMDPDIGDLPGGDVLADAIHFDQETFRQAATEPRSRVTFDIEPAGERVKLTVVHDGFEPGSVVLQSVSTGWPQVLSGLKTLLESAAPLPA